MIPGICEDVRKVGKTEFHWWPSEKTEIYPLDGAKSWVFTKYETLFRQSDVMTFSHGLKRSYLATRTLKIHAIAQKGHSGYFYNLIVHKMKQHYLLISW